MFKPAAYVKIKKNCFQRITIDSFNVTRTERCKLIDIYNSSLIDDGFGRSGAQSITGSRRSGGPTGYSTSVPINVPAWMVGGTGRSQSTQNEDEVMSLNNSVLFVLLV